MEHVSGRIRYGIPWIWIESSIGKYQYFWVFGTVVWFMENLIAPLDRAHRVVFGTRVWVLKHDRRRIWHGYTRIHTRHNLCLTPPQGCVEKWFLPEQLFYYSVTSASIFKWHFTSPELHFYCSNNFLIKIIFCHILEEE